MLSFDLHFSLQQIQSHFPDKKIFVIKLPIGVLMYPLRLPDKVELGLPAVYVMIKFNDATMLRNHGMFYHSHWEQKAECVADIIPTGDLIMLKNLSPVLALV